MKAMSTHNTLEKSRINCAKYENGVLLQIDKLMAIEYVTLNVFARINENKIYTLNCLNPQPEIISNNKDILSPIFTYIPHQQIFEKYANEFKLDEIIRKYQIKCFEQTFFSLP